MSIRREIKDGALFDVLDRGIDYTEAHSGDGYAPSNSIFFKGATGVAPLRAYLETLGYTKEKRCLGEKEIWSKPDQVKGDIFYLYFNAATGEVELTKVMNY